MHTECLKRFCFYVPEMKIVSCNFLVESEVAKIIPSISKTSIDRCPVWSGAVW